MQPEITYNQEKKGIEVRFASKPGAQTRTEMHNMGFRYHRGKKFWYAPVTEARIVFAKQLQESSDVTPAQDIAEASFEATMENISAGNFSYVTFAVKSASGKAVLEDYIVFEPLRAKAEALAQAFALQRYGDNLQEITVYPRNYKRKARELFQHGMILTSLLHSKGTNSIMDDGKPSEKPAAETNVESISDKKLQDDTLENTEPTNGDIAASAKDPLTNEHGVYTKETAGKNFERIEIPMSKAAKHHAQVEIVKTSAGDFRFGVHTQKLYGDYSGGGFAPSLRGNSFADRKEALGAALQIVYNRFASDTDPEDKSVKLAQGALLAYAASENITLQEIPTRTPNEEASPRELTPEVIEAAKHNDLKEAQWRSADQASPVNKVVINKTTYHQARLRKTLLDKLAGLPLEKQQAIAGELKKIFIERRGLDAYEKGVTSQGRKGEERISRMISLYADDMILDNDLFTRGNYPVMTYLLDILYGVKSDTGAQVHSTAFSGQPSQEDINRKIENLLNIREWRKSPLTAEEKDLIRKYNDHAPGRSELPDKVVKFIWDTAYKHGYQGGPVLDPCVGIGELLKYAPEDVRITGYDHHATAIRIATILYPFARIKHQPFETIFYDKNDHHLKDRLPAQKFDLVISYPVAGPFVSMTGHGAEKDWTQADTNEAYFMTRGLDMLSEHGLLIFLLPFDFMQTPTEAVKQAIADKSIFIDAWRITDLRSDILVLKKNKPI